MAQSLKVSVVGDASSYSRALSQATGATTGFGSKVGGVFGRLGKTIAIGGAAAIGGFAVAALKAAGDFEQSMNVFQSVSKATGDQMGKVSKLAKDLGNDMSLPATSAKDAAVAMTELAKGGLTVAQAMSAAKGVLQLSAAASIDNATAAQITARALKAFSLEGSEATRVADVLANAANASTGEITDFALGLQQSSAVASQWGLTINETTAALMAMADAGVIGADAGTSLKTFLQALIPTGAKSAAAMKDLGVNVFDSQGKFVGLSSVVGQFSKGLSKMTQEQQAAALKTIFGSDAVRAANILFKAGVKGLAEYVKKTEEQGAAAALAAAKMKGFKGALEGFKSSFETLLIVAGEPFLHFASTVVRGLATATTAFAGFITRISKAQGFKAKISVVFDVARDAFDQIQQLLFGGSSGRAGAGFGGMTLQINQGLVSKIRDAFASLDWSSVGKSVIDGITNALKKAGDLAKQLAGTISDAIDKVNWDDVGRKLGPGFATMMLSAVAAILDPAFWAKNWDLLLAIILAVFGRGLGRLAAPLGKLLAKPFGDALLFVGKQIERVSPRLAKAVVDGFVALPGLVAKALGLIGPVVRRVFTGLETLVRTIFGRLGGLAVFTIKVLGIDIAINAIADFATGPVWGSIQTAFTTVESVATNTWAAIAAGVTTFGSTIAGAMTAAWEAVRAAMVTVLTTLQGAATTAWNAITTGVSTFGSGLVSAMTTAWNAVRTATTTVLTTITGAVTTAFTTMQSGVTTGMTAIGTAATTGWHAVSTATTTALTPIAAAVTTAFASMRTGVTTGMTAISGAMTTAWTAIKGAAVAAWNAVVGAITNAIGAATTAATAVGRGIVTGIGQGLSTLFAVVKGGLDKIWGIISNVASLAFNAAKAIGAQIVQGILSGLGDIASKVGGALKSGAEKALRAIDPRNLKPWSPISHWAVLLAHELTKEVDTVERVLGASLVKALTAALRGATDKAGDVAVKGMNNVGKLIVAAAKKYGVDAKAALAVAMTEGGIKFGAVGDKGHSFGPFQMADFGALAHMTSAAAKVFANSAAGVDYALRKMAESGAKGLTGLAAIKQIIGGPGWGFERPANAAASVAKAFEFFKTLGPEVAGAVAKAGPMVSTQIRQIAALVKQYAPLIGLEQARGVVAGLVQGQPTLLQQARAGMLAVVAAQKKAVTEAKGAFVSAFNDLANAALTAFDTRWAAWIPPAQRLLDKMQIAEQVKQVQDQLATAMTAISGGGAFDASVLSKQLGDSLATAMSQALGSIAGAKTEEALNKVAAQVQTQVLAAIDQTAATATTQAQAAVDAARTALTAAQAGGDPDAIAAAQAALDTAVNNQKTLEAAILAEKELALGQLAAAETRRHEAIGAIQREGLAKQLADLKGFMLKHPEEWGKMGAAVNAILGSFNTKMQSAGHAWADKFGDGVRAGIPAAVAAARALAAAVAAVMPSTSSPLKPAKTGPLSFHPRTMGKAWASSFASGLASGNMGNIVGSLMTGAPVSGGGMVAAAAGGGMVINLTVHAETDNPARLAQALVEPIRRELYRVKGRNGSLDF